MAKASPTRTARTLWWGVLIGGLALFLGGASPWVGYRISVPSTIAAGHSAAGIFHWSGLLGFYLGVVCWVIAILGVIEPLRWKRLVWAPAVCAVGALVGAVYIYFAWPHVLAAEDGARSGAELLGFGGDVERFLTEGADRGISMDAGIGIGPWIVVIGAALVITCSILLSRMRSGGEQVSR